MARSAFVTTTTKRLDLTGEWEGQHVEVKEHIGVADQKRIEGSAFTSLRTASPSLSSPGEAEAGVDLGRLYMTQLKVYLVSWHGESFNGADGKPVDVTSTAIDMLEPDLAGEITDRLRDWLAAREADKAANPTSGGKRPEQRSA